MAEQLKKENYDDNSAKTYCALFGYAGAIGYPAFGAFVRDTPANAVTLEKYTGIDEQLLRHHGDDFFAGAFYTYTASHVGLTVCRAAADKLEMEKTVNFIDENYRLIRSAIAFTGLAMIEGCQAVARNSAFDWADMAAYGLGMTAFCHAYDIGCFINNVPALFKTNKPPDLNVPKQDF